MVTTSNDTTAGRIRFDDLTADEQQIAWDLFQGGLTLPEACSEARGAAAGLDEYAAEWDRDADELLLAAYWPAIDSVEELTPEPEPEPPTPAAPSAAALKAAYHLAGGLDIRRMGAAYLVPSGSRAGVIHRVQDGQCSCEAGQHGRDCWHLQAVEQFTSARLAA